MSWLNPALWALLDTLLVALLIGGALALWALFFGRLPRCHYCGDTPEERGGLERHLDHCSLRPDYNA